MSHRLAYYHPLSLQKRQTTSTAPSSFSGRTRWLTLTGVCLKGETVSTGQKLQVHSTGLKLLRGRALLQEANEDVGDRM